MEIDIERPLEENLKLLVEAHHSRYPLVRGGLHDVLGVLHVKQVLAFALRNEKPDLAANLQPSVYVPETLTGMELLENFRDNHISIAFVVDERGEVKGMVTLQDLLEAVLGEFKPHDPEDAWARAPRRRHLAPRRRHPHAGASKDRLELKSLPEEDKGRYHTLSGLVMLLLARVPRTGDHVEWDGWRFEVIDMDGKAIDKVLASRVQRMEEPDK